MQRPSLLFAVLLVASGVASAKTTPAWLVGTWTVTADEDGTPSDTATFTKDGKYINYGFSCSVHSEMPFHIYAGDIYITSEIPGKGPIAIVFRPSKDHHKLTYTSPRTRNNAVMERLPSNPCAK